MPDSTPDAPSTGRGLNATLKTKIGPLPAYGWGIIGIGFVGGFWYLKKRNKGTPTVTNLPFSTVSGAGPSSNGNYGGSGAGSPGSTGNGSAGSGPGNPGANPTPPPVTTPPPATTPPPPATTPPPSPYPTPSPGPSPSTPPPVNPPLPPSPQPPTTGQKGSGVQPPPVVQPPPASPITPVNTTVYHAITNVAQNGIPQSMLTPGRINYISIDAPLSAGLLEGWTALNPNTGRTYAQNEMIPIGNVQLVPTGNASNPNPYPTTSSGGIRTEAM